MHQNPAPLNPRLRTAGSLAVPLALLLATLLAGISAPPAGAVPPHEPDLTLTEVRETAKPVTLRPILGDGQRFDKPVWFGPLPGRPGHHVVLEHQTAKAWRLEAQDDGSPARHLFANLAGEVNPGPWEGLVCLAFHPGFPDNRRYFVKHETLVDGQRHTVVAERRASDDLLRDSGAPARRLLAIRQPADNHNGGTIAFGPDGFLYIAMGDGGPQEDPNGFTQSGESLLGKMLRIDVDHPPAEGLAYAIPADNPFVDVPGIDPAIFAFGLREPWRFSFDPANGELWVGDVGQYKYEEVTIVRAGENHGWNVYEGYRPFKDTRYREGVEYVPPVAAWDHTLAVSITGGNVYRARRESPFHGVYVCGDFGTLRLFGITHRERRLETIRQIGIAPAPIASFGLDEHGEIHIVGYDGMIYRIDFEGATFP